MNTSHENQEYATVQYNMALMGSQAQEGFD